MVKEEPYEYINKWNQIEFILLLECNSSLKDLSFLIIDTNHPTNYDNFQWKACICRAPSSNEILNNGFMTPQLLWETECEH